MQHQDISPRNQCSISISPLSHIAREVRPKSRQRRGSGQTHTHTGEHMHACMRACTKGRGRKTAREREKRGEREQKKAASVCLSWFSPSISPLPPISPHVDRAPLISFHKPSRHSAKHKKLCIFVVVVGGSFFFLRSVPVDFIPHFLLFVQKPTMAATEMRRAADAVTRSMAAGEKRSGKR